MIHCGRPPGGSPTLTPPPPPPAPSDRAHTTAAAAAAAASFAVRVSQVFKAVKQPVNQVVKQWPDSFAVRGAIKSRRRYHAKHRTVITVSLELR